MKRIIVVFLTIMLLITSLCGCGFREKDGATQTDTIYYNYNSLTYIQQDIYNEILEDALNVTNEFELFDATDTDVVSAYMALVYDHPEIFWLSDGYKYTLYEYLDFIPFLDIFGVNLTAASMEINDELRTKKEELDKKTEEIVSLASEFSSDYEKILFVHDYIVDNTEYNDEVSEIITSEEEIDTLYNAQTAYGCLVEGSAICSGYSKAFQLIMQKLGFVCGSAFGTTKEDNVPHQWNYILYDGKFCFVDTTWDDSSGDEDLPEYNCYEYFLIGEDEISYSHELDTTFNFPVCEGADYNYYDVNELCDEDGYDYATTKAIITKQLNNDYIVVKYSSPEECKKAVKELFDNSKIFNVSNRFNRIKYFVSNTGSVIYIIEA